MKKQILSIFAAATMLFATSCSEEELTYESASKQNVTFKVEMEGAGASSRTINDGAGNAIEIGHGKMATQLFYAVYESGKEACLLEGTTTMSQNGTASVVIPLVNGLEFDLVFLAYNPTSNVFGLPARPSIGDNGLCAAVDLTNLTLKNGLAANQEAYDAFYHVQKNYKTLSNSTTPVKLHHMFAQLNVATEDADLQYAKQLGVEITESAIEVTGVPTIFNARNETVDGEETVSFSRTSILKHYDANVVNGYEKLTVNDKNFNYLAMAYVLAGAESSLHDIKVSFYRNDSKDDGLVNTRSIASVPLQRNYRTNITGFLLTQQEAFDITLQEGYGDREHNVSVGDVVVAGNATDLQTAIDNAQPGVPVEIQLGADITLGSRSSRATASEGLTIPAGVTVILDLNGYDLSYSVTNTGASAIINNNGTLTISNNATEASTISFVAGNLDTQETPSYATNTITNTGTLTIDENVIVTNGSEGGASYAVDNHGVFTLNGGTLVGKRCALRVAKYNQDNVKFTMNSGLVTAATPAWIQLPGSDASVAPNITVDIKGGTMKTTKESSADNKVMYTYSYGNSHANTSINISGGEFLGGTVSIGSGYKGDAPTLSITGGKFDYDVLQWLENDEYKIVYQVPIIISTAEELAALGGTKINGTYELAADIDMTGVEMKSMEISGGATVVFNGKGYTISNLNLAAAGIHGMTGNGNEVAGLFDLSAPATTVSLTVNDLKIKNATVACSGYAAAIVGYNSNGGTVITLNDVDVEGATVTANSVAALVGYTTGEVNLTDCDVTDLDLRGEEGRPEKVGALVGSANQASCAVTTTNCTNNTEYGDYGRVINGASWNGTKFMTANSQEGLNAIVSSGNNVKMDLGKGNYRMPDGSEGLLQGKTITISGTKETVIDAKNVDTNDQFVTGATLVFDGVTLNFNDGSGNIYMGFANTKELIYKNCKIIGMQFLYGEKVTFENCILDSSANTGEPHAVWTYGAKNISFTECEFIYGNRAINCYKDQDIDGGKQVVNFNKCKFTTAATDSEGAVEINSSAFSVGIEVNLIGCTAPAYGEMAYVSKWDGTNGAKTTINIK